MHEDRVIYKIDAGVVEDVIGRDVTDEDLRRLDSVFGADEELTELVKSLIHEACVAPTE